MTPQERPPHVVIGNLPRGDFYTLVCTLIPFSTCDDSCDDNNNMLVGSMHLLKSYTACLTNIMERSAGNFFCSCCVTILQLVEDAADDEFRHLARFGMSSAIMLSMLPSCRSVTQCSFSTLTLVTLCKLAKANRLQK